jgi:hypothetical protein
LLFVLYVIGIAWGIYKGTVIAPEGSDSDSSDSDSDDDLIDDIEHLGGTAQDGALGSGISTRASEHGPREVYEPSGKSSLYCLIYVRVVIDRLISRKLSTVTHNFSSSHRQLPSTRLQANSHLANYSPYSSLDNLHSPAKLIRIPPFQYNLIPRGPPSPITIHPRPDVVEYSDYPS